MDSLSLAKKTKQKTITMTIIIIISSSSSSRASSSDSSNTRSSSNSSSNSNSDSINKNLILSIYFFIDVPVQDAPTLQKTPLWLRCLNSFRQPRGFKVFKVFLLTRWTTKWSCCRTAGANSSSLTTFSGRWSTPRRAQSYWSPVSRWVVFFATRLCFAPPPPPPCGREGPGSLTTFPSKLYWSPLCAGVAASLKID